MIYNKRRVRNIDTGEVFESMQEAAKAYFTQPNSICRCCRSENKTCVGYRWEYVDEKLGKLPWRACIPVKNLDTEEVFESAREASKKYNVSIQSVRKCCRMNENTPDKKYKACGYRWVYCLFENER